nr:Abi family protein [Rhodococcus sp. UFZ-B548]
MNHSAYGKPFKTIEEQRELLQSRGMTISDTTAAERWLHSIGYYRLSGYWYPHRIRNQPAGSTPVIEDHFTPGTSFEQILDLYEFDRKLKLLVLDAIERIEVAMRLRVGHTLGRRGAFAHTDPNALSTEFVGVSIPRCLPPILPGSKVRTPNGYAKFSRTRVVRKKNFPSISPVNENTVDRYRYGWSPRSSTSVASPASAKASNSGTATTSQRASDYETTPAPATAQPWRVG